MNMKRTLGRLAIALASAGLMASAMAETTIAYITNGNTNEGWTLINGSTAISFLRSDFKLLNIELLLL